MTFQAYLDNIQEKTGLAADDFFKLAKAKGFTKPGTKATSVLDWLKADYDLGRGHGMALVHYIQVKAGLKEPSTPH